MSGTPQFLHDLILYGIPVAFIVGFLLGGYKVLTATKTPPPPDINKYRS